MVFESKAEIYRQPDGQYIFETRKQIMVCRDRDEVGANLEPMLWPLIVDLLKDGEPITIKVFSGLDD